MGFQACEQLHGSQGRNISWWLVIVFRGQLELFLLGQKPLKALTDNALGSQVMQKGTI